MIRRPYIIIMYLKTEGIVLREAEYKDNDKLLTVLTREYGRMTLKARGVRGKSSRLKAACQLLTYSEFTLLEYQGYHVITEAEPKQMFPELRDDLELLSLASYFAQVTEVTAQEDSPDPALLALILNALYALCTLHFPQKRVKAAFEFRVACLAGYTPQLDGCAVCGAKTADRFNVSRGVLQCAGCSDEALDGIRMPVTEGTLSALRYVAGADSRRIFSFSLSDASLDELNGVTEAYLSAQLERGFYTLDFYKSLLREC